MIYQMFLQNVSITKLFTTIYNRVLWILFLLNISFADQLAEIRKVTLARVFCDNSDNVTKMQQQVFFKPISTDNDLLPCNSQLIPKINFKHWSDTVETN